MTNKTNKSNNKLKAKLPKIAIKDNIVSKRLNERREQLGNNISAINAVDIVDKNKSVDTGFGHPINEYIMQTRKICPDGIRFTNYDMEGTPIQSGIIKPDSEEYKLYDTEKEQLARFGSIIAVLIFSSIILLSYAYYLSN